MVGTSICALNVAACSNSTLKKAVSAILQVFESIAMNITWQAPLSAYALIGLGCVDVFPSPKSQKTFGVLPSDVKFILNGGEEHKVVSAGAVATALEKSERKFNVS